MRGITAIVLAGCSMLSGCLEFEQKVKLNADGSGTQSVRMTVQEKVLKDLRQAQPAAHLGLVCTRPNLSIILMHLRLHHPEPCAEHPQRVSSICRHPLVGFVVYFNDELLGSSPPDRRHDTGLRKMCPHRLRSMGSLAVQHQPSPVQQHHA